MPLGAPTLWPETVKRVHATSDDDTGTLPKARTPSTWNVTPAAGRQDHLARIRAERRGDLALRLLHAGPRRAPEAVRRGWVPEGVRPQIGQHGLEHLRAYRRGGRVVEVDQALGHAGKSRS